MTQLVGGLESERPFAPMDDDERRKLHAERRSAARDYNQALSSLLAQLFQTAGPDIARVRNDLQVVLGNAEFLRATAAIDPGGVDVFAKDLRSVRRQTGLN